MSLSDAQSALLTALDAFAGAQGWQIVHEARDTDPALPRLEVSAGPTFHQPMTLDGCARTTALTQVTIVTRWGAGTGAADGVFQAMSAAFPTHRALGPGLLKRPPTPTPALRDEAERRQPVMLELEVFG